MNPVYPKDRVIFGSVAAIFGERYREDSEGRKRESYVSF
jgi:hypothetical protein